MKFTPSLIDRRRFLLTTAAAAASLRSLAQSPTPTTATLTLHPDQPGPHVPANFIGLSYETQQLTTPDFFSPANAGLIAQFKALAPHGVLRIGGNTSDIGWWKPTPTSVRPEIHLHILTGVGQPTSDLAVPITPLAITHLRAFLDATGWTCIYGINLGTNTPARAAEEAAFVAPTLGPKLEYFQLGNEPDLFSTHIRDKATWNADRYFDEWLAEANAIRASVAKGGGHARFGLPDTAGDPEWYARIVDRLLALPEAPCSWCGRDSRGCSCLVSNYTPGTRPSIVALSHHYYIGGPPSNPDMTIAKILAPAPRVEQLAHDIRSAAARLDADAAPPPPAELNFRMPYRMTEGNTCYRGGKPGVSDVFASALWSADYLLQLASLGYAGVNLHGGDAKAVANSLGGTLPGDALVLAAHRDPATHPHPYYTPIALIDDKYVLEPVARGMKFAQQFADTTMIPLDFNPGPVNATAYATRWSTGRICLAIINKDATQDLHLESRDWIVFKTLTSQMSGDSHLEAREANLVAWLSTKPSPTGRIVVPRSSACFFLQAQAPSLPART
jgi:hypothetical protein